MTERTKIMALAVFILLLASLQACAIGRTLQTGEAGPSGINGTFTLFLHGGRFADDMQNVAILDRQGDPYSFELYAPSFNYRIRKDVAGAEAVEEAGRFVRFHHSFWASQWRSILDESGAVIGYEVRPLYRPLDTGYPDILDITYVISDKIVTAHIRFKSGIERALLNEDRPLIFRHMR